MNREEWLNQVAERMAPWFENQGYSLPRYRVAIGFPSTGKRGKRIGECWDGRASADGTFEVLIRPDQSDPIEVAAILAHELVHAAVGLGVRAQGRISHRCSTFRYRLNCRSGSSASRPIRRSTSTRRRSNLRLRRRRGRSAGWSRCRSGTASSISTRTRVFSKSCSICWTNGAPISL